VVIPATVYGPGNDIELETAHVMGALIGKFYDATISGAKEVVVWGSGKPRREFIYTEDFVDACLFLMEKYNQNEMINVGCGNDVSVKELAEIIKEVSGFKGKIVFDATKPDGTMKKCIDNSKLTQLGWQAQVELKEGIKKTYEWYKQTKKHGA
jgi:GDP-L-fucose synthase